MNVLMLGWEFPPFFAGGVGIACEAMSRALAERGVGVTYLMPHGPERMTAEGVRVLSVAAGDDTIPAGRSDATRAIASLCYAAAAGSATGASAAAAAWSQGVKPSPIGTLYGADLLERIDAFAAAAVNRVRAARVEFDVIHAHDWTTFRAGLALRRATGKPLLAHVHITEFDKSGGDYADAAVYALEREGMHGADVTVAVSERVRRTCVDRYGVVPGRTEVVYNGVESDSDYLEPVPFHAPMILFLGRVTLQKGPQYFLQAAARVHSMAPDVRFVMAGAGEMLPSMIEQAAELGLGRSMLFPGFVDREQAAVLYRSADVFVMPSVSEPFGIVPLEAMDQAVPTIVSRQSGAAEVLHNAMKVDFWDVDDLAEKMLAAVRYGGLASELARNGRREVARMGWDTVAGTMEELYTRSIA